MILHFAMWDLGYPKGYSHFYETHQYKTPEAREKHATGRPWFDFDTKTGEVKTMHCGDKALRPKP